MFFFFYTQNEKLVGNEASQYTPAKGIGILDASGFCLLTQSFGTFIVFPFFTLCKCCHRKAKVAVGS